MTAKQEFEYFVAKQKEQDYKLGDFTGSEASDMEQYTKLKIAVAQEQEKINGFNLEWDAKFEALTKKHDEERVALGKKKQLAEDALFN